MATDSLQVDGDVPESLIETANEMDASKITQYGDMYNRYHIVGVKHYNHDMLPDRFTRTKEFIRTHYGRTVVCMWVIDNDA